MAGYSYYYHVCEVNDNDEIVRVIHKTDSYVWAYQIWRKRPNTTVIYSETGRAVTMVEPD